jgi:hypothetical protein
MICGVVRRLSTELGLADESQDWGIVNADPGRLREFIAVYERPGLSRPGFRAGPRRVTRRACQAFARRR